MVEEAARCTQPAWPYNSLFDKAERRGRIEMPAAPPFAEGAFKARFDDIDFNGHVTQASHVQWMMDSLSFEFMKTHTLREIEIIYEKEIPPAAAVEVRSFSEAAAVWGEPEGVRLSHWVLNGEGQPHSVARSVWQKD